MLQLFHGIDLQRVLAVESSALHRLTKPQIYTAAENSYAEWHPLAKKSSLPKAKSTLRDWLVRNKIDRWYVHVCAHMQCIRIGFDALLLTSS